MSNLNWQQSLRSMTSCLRRILSVSDLQCAWILLLYCAAARPNFLLRVVHPCLTARFAAHHDASLRSAKSQLVRSTDPDVLGCRQPPFLTWWFGVAQCRLDHKRSILVELGRQPPDDPEQAPKRGRPDFARTVTQEHSSFPCCCSGCSTGGVDALGFRGPVLGECDSRSETCSA